jgi:hypothetical protein
MKLVDLGYQNLYFKNEKDRFATFYGNGVTEISKIGFQTNTQSRGQILTKLEETIRTNSVRFYSTRFYEELKTFVWKGRKAQAQKGKNDDLVIAAAIGVWLFDADPKHHKQTYDINKAMLEGFKTNLSKQKKPTNKWAGTSFNPFRPHHMPDMPQSGSIDGIDYSWLL